MEKKKLQRKAISLETKIEILDLLAKGEGSTDIGKRFSLGESTIRAIKNNEVTIRNSVISGTKLHAKLSSYSRNALIEKTEQALVIWIEDLTQKRIPISGNLIKQKAVLFYEQIKQSEPSVSASHSGKEFLASKGWLTSFLKRNAFHNIKITGETASADEEAAKNFQKKFIKIIEDGGYCPDQVFNADETRLFWKKMPSRTYIAKSEKKVSGFKASKDRVTLLLCSNLSGDRMLKPLLVNRSLRPHALKCKDLKHLPVHWMANTKAWVTTAIFTEWFHNIFVPEVETYMWQKGLAFKVLLIVDNAPSHPHLEHPNVQLLFFPPNTTSIIQPLDQGIIATFKKYYIKHTYQFILDKLELESLTVTDVWKKFTILDCLNHVASAIADITPQTLNACWKTIWPVCVANNATDRTSTIIPEIISLANKIGGEGFDTFSKIDVNELLVDDVLSDDTIIGMITDNIQVINKNSEVKEEPAIFTEKAIREGLELCNKLENHFLVNDTDSERAFKFQRELKNCISGYCELYKRLVKPSQSLITDYFVKGKKSSQHLREVGAYSILEEPLSSSMETDISPVRKRYRLLPDIEDNSDERM